MMLDFFGTAVEITAPSLLALARPRAHAPDILPL